MSDTLTVQLNRDRYRPGETLAGRVSWSFERAPRRLSLRLFWKTSGAGTEDVGLVEEQVVEHPEGQQSHEFVFRLPVEPYSYDGRIVAVSWGVEAVAAKASALAGFVMRPDGA